MPPLFATTLFGISAAEWLKMLAIAAGVIALLWAIRELIVRRLKEAAATETWVDDLLLLLAQRTSRVYMVAMGAVVAVLYKTSEQTLPTWLRLLIVAVFSLQLLRWANATVDFWLRRMDRSHSGADDARGSFAVVGVLVRIAVFLLVLVLALDNFGVNVTALVTGLGITGIAVALAVQNILGDLLAALAITFDKPFTVGDEISVGDVTGRVERLGLKTTRVRLATGEEVSVANAEVMKTRLTNISRSHTRMLALTVSCAATGVSGASLLALTDALAEAARGVSGVQSAVAALHSVVDGKARVVVESVLRDSHHVAAVRGLLVASLCDAAAVAGQPVLAVEVLPGLRAA